MKVTWPFEFPGALWYDKQEEKAVVNVIRRKAPFRYYGPNRPKYVEKFEATARRFYGVKYALGVSGGTGALFTAMRVLDIGPGCEVIVPSFMWVATIGAVVSAGAIPVLCEVDDSLTLDPVDLEKKITPRTRLIVPVHMAGAPSNMKAIMAIARRHGVTVFEDSAQANGGTFHGRKLGTFGPLGMFSLQMNKNCTTGEGGLLVTNDERLYGLACAAHDVGAPWIDGVPDINLGYINWGSGRRMSELIGAVANVQLTRLPGIIKGLRASKARIKRMLIGTPGLSFRRIHDPAGDTGGFLVVMLDTEAKAKKATAAMKAAGLSRIHRLDEYGMHIYYHIPQLVTKVPLSSAGEPWNLPRNRHSQYNYAKGACPRSDDLFGRSILIPIPSRLTRRQEKWAAEGIRSAVASA